MPGLGARALPLRQPAIYAGDAQARFDLIVGRRRDRQPGAVLLECALERPSLLECESVFEPRAGSVLGANQGTLTFESGLRWSLAPLATPSRTTIVWPSPCWPPNFTSCPIARSCAATESGTALRSNVTWSGSH